MLKDPKRILCCEWEGGGGGSQKNVCTVCMIKYVQVFQSFNTIPRLVSNSLTGLIVLHVD